MDITIERLGINGEGVGKITTGEDSGKVIFVKGALPTEVVAVDNIKSNKNYCIGRVKKICKQSKYRKVPKCEYFSECGGCHLQHLEEIKQREYKKENVLSTIKKISGILVDDCEIIYDNYYNYRNKMAFPVGIGENGGYIGMFVGESHKVIPIDRCLIASESINGLIPPINDYLSKNTKGFDFIHNKGDVKYIVIRANDDSVLVTIVTTQKINVDVLREVLCKCEKNIGISTIISDNKEDILSGKYCHNLGIKNLQFDEFDISYKVNNRGFLQVNDKIKKLLYSKVLENIKTSDIVLDGYSGAGLLSAIISKKCKKVIGVEINSSACSSARELIKENNLNNIEYFEGDVKSYINKCSDYGVNVVVLDPPRAGCDKNILDTINLVNNVSKVVYISCNPATLARDLGVLKECFDIKQVTLFEMFPNTKHIETLVVLERNNQ